MCREIECDRCQHIFEPGQDEVKTIGRVELFDGEDTSHWVNYAVICPACGETVRFTESD